MFTDIPILAPRASPGDPITMRQDFVKGANGPRMNIQSRITPSQVHADAERDQRDMQMARGIGRYLHSLYEGHFWQVEVDSKQGYAAITIPLLLGNWKWKIPLTELSQAMVRKAGGEILERFKIPRSTIDVGAFLGAKKNAVSRASQTPPGGINARSTA
jgi:hypothetical protein